MNVRSGFVAVGLVLLLACSAQLYADLIVWSDDFDGISTGWTIWKASGYTDDWELGTPDSSGGVGGPTGAYSGDNAYATDLNGVYEAYGPTATPPLLVLQLITPALDLTGLPDATFEFVDWVRVERGEVAFDFGDYAALELLDGTGAHLAWLDPLIARLDNAWKTDNAFSLDSYLGQTVKVAFNLYVDDMYPYAGWYVDNVMLTTSVPEPATLMLLAGGIGILVRRRRS